MAIDCLSAGILVADHLCAPISHVPSAGELVLTDDLPLALGGCAANAAMDLNRLGVNVGVLGCVGQDPFGRFIIDSLAARGIDTQGIRSLPGVGTSGTLIINVQGQDRRYIHMLGANAAFTASEISRELVRQAKVFYIGGYLLSGLDQDGLLPLFREAQAAGVKTVLDVVMPGPGDQWQHFDRLLTATDVFLPNRDEAQAITGLDDPVRQAERFLAAGAKTVVITCGGEGTTLMSDHVRLRARTYPVDFVGGTGAGDAFDAGYIAGLLAGEEPRRCLEWGSALGASCVRSISATESVFTREEALAFMDRHRLPIESF